jgi:hypothetical protein
MISLSVFFLTVIVILMIRTNEERFVLMSRTNVSNRNHGQKSERKIDMYIQID